MTTLIVCGFPGVGKSTLDTGGDEIYERPEYEYEYENDYRLHKGSYLTNDILIENGYK